MLCFSPSELRKYFHKHRIQGSSTSTDPLVFPGNPLFPAILLSESNTTWSRSLPHFQHYTDYLERQPAAPTQALTLSGAYHSVPSLASRSSNGSLRVSALPSRGLLPHSSPSTNNSQGRTGQTGLHPDSSRAELHIGSSMAFMPRQL